MPLHDASYKHWDGVHLGLWQRRLVIARNGLTACLQNKWLRHLVVASWGAGLVMTGILFCIGQLLVPDSLVARAGTDFNPMGQAFIKTLTAWLEQNPDISVRATQNVLFYYYCTFLMRAGIFALGMAMPLLITRDLASNAIIIYSSKAVNRGDYLLGKFATAFGLICMTWLGPVCAAWFMGNLLAPDWRFFWHSRAALFHVLVYGLFSTTVLSLLALGISAVSIKEKSTAALWYVWWVIGGVIAPIAQETVPRLRHLSFNYNLDQIALAVFRIGNDVKTGRDNIPILGQMLNNIRPETLAALDAPAIRGALLALLVMVSLATFIVARKAKPE